MASTLSALCPIYGRNNRPSRSTIERLVETFEPQAQYKMLEYFWPQLDDMDLEDMLFQQHGATRHTAKVTINLETKFGERVISPNGPVGLRQVYGLCQKASDD